MLFETSERKKYIILKDGYNKPLLFGLLTMIMVIGLVVVMIINQPDTRKKITMNNDTSLLFSYTTIDTPKYLEYDETTHLGQVLLHITKTNTNKQFNIVYEVYDDTGTKQQMKCIQSENLYEDKESVIDERQLLLQFYVPDNFYYVIIKMEQKDNTYKELIYDYRDTKKVIVKERGKNYLKQLHTEENTLTTLKEKYATLQKEVETYTSMIQSWNKMSVEEKQQNAGKNDEVSVAKENAEKELKTLQKEIEKQKQLIASIKE